MKQHIMSEEAVSSTRFVIEDVTSGEATKVAGTLFLEDGILHIKLDDWGPVGADTAFAALQLHEGKVCLDVWSEEAEGATHSIRIGPQRAIPVAKCGHSECVQNNIDTGDTSCVREKSIVGTCEHCGSGPVCAVCGRDDNAVKATVKRCMETYDEDTLDELYEMVREDFDARASDVNDDGHEGALEWLLRRGYEMKHIRERLD